MANVDLDRTNVPDDDLIDAARDLEKSLLQGAFTPEPPKPEPGPAEPAPAEPAEPAEPEAPLPQPDDPEGKRRDERGRFAKKEEPAAEPQAAAPDEQGKEADTVPLWRLREIAEERRLAQQERDAVKAELVRVQTMIAQQQRQQQAPKAEDVDPLLNPAEYTARMRAEFSEQLRMERLNNNLAMAHMQHGKEFEDGYTALVQSNNPQLVQSIMATGNPGRAIVDWHRQQELLRQTGGDLGKYRDRLRAELLADQGFRKELIAAMQAEANGGAIGNQGQRPSNITVLPPSLSRMTGGAANSSDMPDPDQSDSALFSRVFRK